MTAHAYKIMDLSELRSLDRGFDREWMVYKAASLYIESGFYVLPLVKNGKALPARRYGINYGAASRAKKTVEKWFNPDNGKFAGWNIGIATGKKDGVFVMDVDRHGAEDGFDTLDGLLNGDTLPLGPVQVTPNGGKHYLYRWLENGASSTGKIGPGIDTRGGTEQACKGHIAVYPSTVEGKGYQWESGGPLPVCPKWIAEKMGIPWKPINKQEIGRGNEGITEEDLEELIPLEQIERMLQSIDPDDLDYDSWLKIGMAIKSQYPDESGLSTWDDWSKHGSRYEPKECRIRWDGFSELGSVRIASLFWYANQAGYVPEPKDKKPNKLAIIVERMNTDHALVVIGNKIRILVEIRGQLQPMNAGYHLLSRADFRTLMENDTIYVESASGKGKMIPVSDVWLADPIRRTYPKGIGMFPNENPKGYYNTWRGFAVEPQKGSCKLFKDHILNVICEGNKKLNEFVLDWCADLFQDPSNPKGTAIVMRGDEGTGKGTFANTIGMMCAPHYTHLIDENHLTGQFNSHLSDSLVLFADEITWGGNVKSEGKLKGMVTEEYFLLERKGVDAVSHRNMLHVLIASNEEWVVPAGSGSRRWLILDVSKKHKGDRRYFQKINEELNNGGKEAFLYEMQKRKITTDLTVALETDALHEHREISMSQKDSIALWWSYVVSMESIPEVTDMRDENNVGWPEAASISDIYHSYENWCLTHKKHPAIVSIFGKRMLTYGCDKTRKRLPGGKRLSGYTIPPIDKAQEILNKIIGITKINGDNEDE